MGHLGRGLGERLLSVLMRSWVGCDFNLVFLGGGRVAFCEMKIEGSKP